MDCQVFQEITNKFYEHIETVSNEHNLKHNISKELVKPLSVIDVMLMETTLDNISTNHSQSTEHCDDTGKCSPDDLNVNHSSIVSEKDTDDVVMRNLPTDDSITEGSEAVLLREETQDAPHLKCIENPLLERSDDDMLETEHSKNFENEHIPPKLNATPSYDEIYNLRPFKVNCLQSLKDLRQKCDKMGLILCTADSSVNETALRFDYMIQNCSIEGLYPYENLKELCNNLQLKFKNGNVGMVKKRIVDLIIGHKNKRGTKFYLVKWKRLSSKRNSWVTESVLLPEYKSLISYYKTVCHLHSAINHDMVKHFYHELVNRRPYDTLSLIKLCALLFGTTEDFIRELSFTFSEMKEKCKTILSMPLQKLNKIRDQLLNLMQFSEQRKRVLINLNEWERDINNFNPATYIEVENQADLEMAPTNFQFIHDYVRNQESEEEPICFCECDNCYDNRKSCCPHDSDGEFPYSRYRRLMLRPGYPIYECNNRCKCSSDCINRVVQHGQKVKVAIFRTSNGCGWGLKTLEVIQKDQFVLEYLGEIITSDEAEARGELYDFIGRTYLFDLDYGVGDSLYTVDAGHMGNAGHFINHSCDPNLHVFAVWINNPDPNLPRLALFSKRKINRGEELTFDYKIVKNRDGFGVGSSPPVGVQCKCNSKNCRKYLF